MTIYRSIREWISAHDDITHPGRNFYFHMCSRFGRVKRLIAISPVGFGWNVRPEAWEEVFQSETWGEVMRFTEEGPTWRFRDED